MAGRPCIVCNHPKRRDIERAVASGRDFVSVSLEFAVTEFSLARHIKNHVPATLAKVERALGLRDLAAGIGINEEVSRLYSETREILDESRNVKDLETALKAIAQARANLELMAKLTGKLNTAEIEIHIHPEVIALRQRLTAWIVERYPADVDALAGLFEAKA